MLLERLRIVTSGLLSLLRPDPFLVQALWEQVLKCQCTGSHNVYILCDFPRDISNSYVQFTKVPYAF